MSSSNITLVWRIGSKFSEDSLAQIFEESGSTKQEPKGEHEKRIWKLNGLTLKLYDRTLVVQGKLSSAGLPLLEGINLIEGLSLDRKNQAIFRALKPISQNALLCEECGEPFYLISSSITGLDISFTNRCGHLNTMRLPFSMCVNRMLLDFNVLRSKNLSRLIELGYFEGSELLIPAYLMRCADKYLKGSKRTFSVELENLKRLERQGKILIYNFEDNIEIPKTREDFDVNEDRNLLEIAQITNSIIITSDINFKDQAILAKRPVLYLDPDTVSNVKVLHETRIP